MIGSYVWNFVSRIVATIPRRLTPAAAPVPVSSPLQDHSLITSHPGAFGAETGVGVWRRTVLSGCGLPHIASLIWPGTGVIIHPWGSRPEHRKAGAGQGLGRDCRGPHTPACTSHAAAPLSPRLSPPPTSPPHPSTLQTPCQAPTRSRWNLPPHPAVRGGRECPG